MKTVSCPYCGSQAELKDAFAVYRRLGYGMVYICPDESCDAYVGVHEGTDKPKGSLANAELRQLRQAVHAVIDPLWRETRRFDRKEVYEAATHVLGVKEFHVGEMREKDAFDFLARKDEIVEQIRLVIERARLQKLAVGGSNILNVLRYLYVESQPAPRNVLSQSAYKGHATSFKAGVDAGLVKRVKSTRNNKVYFALTPAGCSALGVPVR